MGTVAAPNSVHLKTKCGESYISFDIVPTRCNIMQYIYFWKTALHVSGGIHPSSGAHTTVFTVSGTCQPLLLPSVIVEELELV
jgi:hypothetical protein